MKKIIVCALVLLFTLCVPTFASATECVHLWDEENEYGGMSGFYYCVDDDGYDYFGYGEPLNPPGEA